MPKNTTPSLLREDLWSTVVVSLPSQEQRNYFLYFHQTPHWTWILFLYAPFSVCFWYILLLMTSIEYFVSVSAGAKGTSMSYLLSSSLSQGPLKETLEKGTICIFKIQYFLHEQYTPFFRAAMICTGGFRKLWGGVSLPHPGLLTLCPCWPWSEQALIEQTRRYWLPLHFCGHRPNSAPHHLVSLWQSLSSEFTLNFRWRRKCSFPLSLLGGGGYS